MRIVDVTKLARVSRPTFYSLYADKEALFLDAYDEISQSAARTVTKAYLSERSRVGSDEVPIRAFCALAAAEPEAMSLFVLGAFGAGAKALERRKQTLDGLEQIIRSSRNPDSPDGTVDLTAKVLIGATREVTAARLRQRPLRRAARARGGTRRLGGLLSAAAPERPAVPRTRPRAQPRMAPESRCPSARALAQGRLPSGRHALPRKFIVNSQRERIVDATAATVAAKGLAGLTIPEIARRANVSHQTFYEIYDTKHDAFLGALKVGMHQALLVTAEAYEAHSEDWPRAVAAGLRALIDYLVSEPAHAHLTLVDTFAASPEAIEIRDSALHAFSAYLSPGYELAKEPRGTGDRRRGDHRGRVADPARLRRQRAHLRAPETSRPRSSTWRSCPSSVLRAAAAGALS